MEPFDRGNKSIISALTFSYLQPAMHKANKQGSAFSTDSLPSLNPEFTAKQIYNEFSRKYYKQNDSLMWSILKSLGSSLYAFAFINLCLLIIYIIEPILIQKLIHLIERENSENSSKCGLCMCINISIMIFRKCMIFNFF